MKIAEVIWTSGAAEDFIGLATEESSSTRFNQALNAALDLLKVFPGHGAPVDGSKRMRRILVGAGRNYGIYYAVVGDRLIVSALVDLRIDPDRITEMLRSRGIS